MQQKSPAMRQFRGKTVIIDLLLIAALVSLAVIFFQRNPNLRFPSSYKPTSTSSSSISSSSIDGRPDPDPEPLAGSAAAAAGESALGAPRAPAGRGAASGRNVETIDARIRRVPDARSPDCQRRRYSEVPRSTIIVVFSDYQLYDARVTMASIFNDQDATRSVNEVILVDDGSTLDHVVEDADKFVASLEGSSPPVRLVRLKVQHGTPRARAFAVSQRARTDVVVLLDAGVVCGHGWLTPLVDLLRDHGEASIAVPHLDRIRSAVSLEYIPTDADLVATPSWTLAVRMRRLAMSGQENGGDDDDVSPFSRDSPVIRGSAFAVRRTLLRHIGGLYDEGLEDGGGGEHLELSLRTWLCGGKIKIATCSHVGVLNLADQQAVNSPRNIRRIAETWFGSRRDLVYRITGLTPSNAGNNSNSSSSSRRPSSAADSSVESTAALPLRDTSNCKKVDWYMENVGAMALRGPSTNDPQEFGMLQVETGRCAKMARDGKIELEVCENDNRVQLDTTFELTADARLLTASGKCLTVIQTAYIQAEDCRPIDDHQRWQYRGEGELYNEWSKYCATHVTDPDSKFETRQVMMAQPCKAADPKQNVFKRWRFVAT